MATTVKDVLKNTAEAENVTPYLKTVANELCLWAEPTYGDQGEEWEKTLWQAALIAVTVATTAAQIAIAKKQYEIAKAYAKLAQDRWERFRDYYAPLERAMLSEAGNAEYYEPDYDAAKQRATDHVSAAYAIAQEHMADLATRYALCLDTTLTDDLSLDAAIARDDGINYNYRDEEFYAYYKQDQRWNRRSGILNIGRNNLAMSATYAQSANDALSTLGGIVNSGAQGASRLLGYLQTAQETIYPGQFSSATPMTSQASSLGSMVGTGIMATT